MIDADKVNAINASGLEKITRNDSAGFRFTSPKWDFIGGINLIVKGIKTARSAATNINGACQLRKLARYKLNGTPNTEATEKAAIK